MVRWDWLCRSFFVELGRTSGTSPRYEAYARANASVGINGTVLNNVNASPKCWQPPGEVKALADVFRPYGIKGLFIG